MLFVKKLKWRKKERVRDTLTLDSRQVELVVSTLCFVVSTKIGWIHTELWYEELKWMVLEFEVKM